MLGSGVADEHDVIKPLSRAHQAEAREAVVNICVSYRQDPGRTFRVLLRLNRRKIRILQCAGAVLVLAGAILGVGARGAGWQAFSLVMLGVLLMTEVYLLFWIAVHRNREALTERVEVTVTGEKVAARTATKSVVLGWDMVRRIIEGDDFWIFAADRLTMVTLWKQALTADQRAELTAFLASGRGTAAASADW
jgi:hypothetical protein